MNNSGEKGSCASCNDRAKCMIKVFSTIKLTNSDYIRLMSDEELAVWKACGCPPEPRQCTGKCAQCWFDWLKEPYNGETVI